MIPIVLLLVILGIIAILMFTTRNPDSPPKTCIVDVAAADVDTDANGDVTVNIPELRTLVGAEVSAGGGYKAEIQSTFPTSDNDLTVRIYWYDYDAAADGAAIAKTSSLNVCTLHIIAHGY